MSEIELLSPAKNLNSGIQAILHGADAVYIGGPKFGARAAVGNSIDDIKALCNFAHIYNARVYVTLNTILYDEETNAAEKLIWELYDVGVDALIIQDLGILRMNLPPIALHASTQMDNRTIDDIKHRECEGFTRVVLARELSLDAIQKISKQTHLELEAFVHGALCVSYSGKCYASQYCFNRSANRGECAQFCRMSFDLIDDLGNIYVKDKHLLSLKDMCRIEHLESMMDAGVVSFKIEGRLKDEKYVKNVTCAYRLAIDKILSKRKEDFKRASYGVHTYDFTPNVERTFHRGYTSYFLNSKNDIIHNPYTPKSMGECIGIVTSIGKHSFDIKYSKTCSAPLRAGDGICFISKNTEKLIGASINKVDEHRIYLNKTTNELAIGILIYRNFDFEFDKLLTREIATRKLPIDIKLELNQKSFVLSAKVLDNSVEVKHQIEIQKQIAVKSTKENIIKQLQKLGNTPFVANSVKLETDNEYFIPTSILNENRRLLVQELEEQILKEYQRESPGIQKNHNYRKGTVITSKDNISNRLSKEYLEECGAIIESYAFELDSSTSDILMTCKHCIFRNTSNCYKRKGGNSHHRIMYLRLSDGRTFQLKMNCDKCEMQVLKSLTSK